MRKEELESSPAVEIVYSDYNTFKNKAKCLKCGDIICSTHVHHFQSCSCGSIFVDGGNEYWRSGGHAEHFERIFEYLD
jgi:hypothetical protein